MELLIKQYHYRVVSYLIQDKAKQLIQGNC